MSEGMPVVRFEYTLDDFVDAQVRYMRRNKAYQTMRRRGLALMMVISGAVFCALSSGTLPQRLGAFVCGAFIAFVAHHFGNQKAFRKRLRKLSEGRMPVGTKVECEVELAEAGVHVRQTNASSLIPWEEIESVCEAHDAFEISGRRMSFVMVRKRGFADRAGEDLFRAELARRVPSFKPES